MANQSAFTGPVYDAKSVATLLGIAYTAEQLAAFGPRPAPLEGFITFFDPGWSILRIRKAVAGKGTIFYCQDWYDTQEFAQKEGPACYRQLRMEAVKDSFRKTFAEQRKLLAVDEEVPLARVVLTGMVIHFLATGQRLFPTCWVRCADTASDGVRVYVGYFDDHGLYVGGAWGPRGVIGVAASRKVP